MTSDPFPGVSGSGDTARTNTGCGPELSDTIPLSGQRNPLCQQICQPAGGRPKLPSWEGWSEEAIQRILTIPHAPWLVLRQEEWKKEGRRDGARKKERRKKEEEEPGILRVPSLGAACRPHLCAPMALHTTPHPCLVAKSLPKILIFFCQPLVMHTFDLSSREAEARSLSPGSAQATQ